jgi:hypothetical protein
MKVTRHNHPHHHSQNHQLLRRLQEHQNYQLELDRAKFYLKLAPGCLRHKRLPIRPLQRRDILGRFR